MNRLVAAAARGTGGFVGQPLPLVLDGLLQKAGDEHAIMELVMATHSGMTTAEFEQVMNP